MITRSLLLKSLFVLSITLLSMALTLIPAASGVQPVAAQCGTDASSCKVCHQGEEAYPVNDLGAWHQDHAAQDFCQLCHGGDKTASDADVAHAGMFDPLGEQGLTRCVSCHPADSQQKIDTYTDLLASYTPGAPTAAAGDTVAAAEAGYDWRNMALAGVAGFLTAVFGVVVWNMEDFSTRANRS